MRQPRNNHRDQPLMSAQQGALIIKRLERIETAMRTGARAAERRGRVVVKLLERIAAAVERGTA